MWSSPIDVTVATRGVSTLVESSRPPSPVSITAMSTLCFTNQSNAIAVVISKNVAPIFSASGIHRWRKSRTASSLIGFPSTVMRSRKSMRCGEVYRPTFSPFQRSSASAVATTLPFPFVPAT